MMTLTLYVRAHYTSLSEVKAWVMMELDRIEARDPLEVILILNDFRQKRGSWVAVKEFTTKKLCHVRSE